MKYVYPAIFEKELNGYYAISFPDLDGAYTCGQTLDEASCMAEDCMGIILCNIEENGEEVPVPSDISGFENTEKQFVKLISVDLDEYKKRVANLQDE